MKQTCSTDPAEQLQDDMTQFVKDPYGFVMYTYPWGEEGTLLAEEEGPDKWQAQILKDIGHALTHGWVMNEGIKKDCTAGLYISVSSGHGIGKSALMAMLDQWFMSTHPHPQVVTTANTKEQLTSKTGREQAKWHKMMINSFWFIKTATKFICRAAEDTWFSSFIPWSESNPEAFAGTHEKNVLIKYDEASAIPDIIWETTEGAMTEADGVKIWIVFGNPTQNTGRFRECFGKFRMLWLTYKVDSRESKRTDKKLIQKWADAYGDDSDFFRIRVKGEFPRAGSKQFIRLDHVEEAMDRTYHSSVYERNRKIMAVDIARFGGDKTVFAHRQGLAVYDLKKFVELDAVTCAGLIAEEIKAYKPDAVFLDMGNIGAAVFDILVSWNYTNITPVWFGSAADDKTIYFNKRVEMWGRLREALKNGLMLPNDPELRDDLIGPEYGFTAKEQFQLEKKEDMKARGLSSPDSGDAVAMLYAYSIEETADRDSHRNNSQKAITEYDLLNV